MKEMDHIFVMDEGEVVHQGTHQELLTENAVAYMQLLNPDDSASSRQTVVEVKGNVP